VVKLFLESKSITTSGGLKCRTRSQLEQSVFFDTNDDDTDRLSLYQADVELAPKLLQLQFPCADEGI